MKMEVPKVSEMWADLQHTNKMPVGGVLASCQPELEELMCQIDTMVQARRTEWDREKHVLQAKLEIREKEYNIQRANLQEKHTEIGQLRAQVDNLERTNRDAGAHYDHQLSSLRSEVDHMKKEYERLQKRHGQKNSRDKATKSDLSSSDQKSSAEIKRLSSRLEEYKTKSSEWDQERRLIRRQLETAESQMKTLEDKYNLAQQQSSSYKAQLDKRKEILDTTEASMKSQISHLENQLHRARDTVTTQETQLGRVRGSLEEALLSQRRALEEKELLEAELRSAQHTARCLEEEATESRMTKEANNEVHRLTQTDLQRANSAVSQLKEALADKEAQIVSLEDKLHNLESEEIVRLRENLSQCRSDLRGAKKAELMLQKEVNTLKNDLSSCSQQNSLLKSQVEEKTNEMEGMIQLQAEVSKLRENLSISKQRHLGEQEGMKSELSSITAELHQRTLAMASVSERATATEKQLRDQDELLEKKSAELQVITAQLEALRVENRHLRRTAINMSSACRGTDDDHDGDDAEKHIHDLQAAYDSSIKALEDQNEKLSDDMTRLRHQLYHADSEGQRKLNAALSESQRTINMMREAEQKRIEEIRKYSAQQVDELQRHLASTVKKYQGEVNELRQQMSSLEDELDSRNNTLTRLGLENEAMSQFVTGLDQLVGVSQRGQCDDDRANIDAQHGSLGYDQGFEEEEDECIDTAERATANFLAQQENHAKELEKRLNLHIEDLKLATLDMLQGRNDASQGHSTTDS